MATEADLSITELLHKAALCESTADSDGAIALYKQAVAKDKVHEYAYDRLMILYRKQKAYKKEQSVLNSALKAFEQFYKPKKSRSKSIRDISDKLNRSFGFTDKKGNAQYEPEPIARWKKRLIVVQKRLQKQV